MPASLAQLSFDSTAALTFPLALEIGMVQMLITGSASLPVLLEVSSDGGTVWGSAMPPGLTTVANILFTFWVAQGLKFRLRIASANGLFAVSQTPV